MIKLEKIISDGMILPRGKTIRIKGQSDLPVTVEFQGKKYLSNPQDGYFKAFLDGIDSYGGPYVMKISDGKENHLINDIYVGEVFLMSGQSNMQFKLQEGLDDYSHDADDPMLRLFSTERLENNEFFFPKDGWVKFKNNNAGFWPSLPYQTGKYLRNELGCAIGLVSCYQGASVIETWLPHSAFDSSIELEIEKKHPDHTDPFFITWNKNSLLYNVQFLPASVISYSSVFYYQGESDTSIEEAKIYDIELNKMVDSWRKELDNPKLHFHIIQISDYDSRDDAGWHDLQAAQKRAAKKMQNATLIESYNICESKDIHPLHKKALSERMAKDFLYNCIK